MEADVIYPILAGALTAFVVFIAPLILIYHLVGDVKGTADNPRAKLANTGETRLKPYSATS